MPAAKLCTEGAVESSRPQSAAKACTRHSESVFCCAIRTWSKRYSQSRWLACEREIPARQWRGWTAWWGLHGNEGHESVQRIAEGRDLLWVSDIDKAGVW